MKQNTKYLALSFFINMKKLKFVKIKCQCGYTNLIPAYENTKCEKCGEVIATTKRIDKNLK